MIIIGTLVFGKFTIGQVYECKSMFTTPDRRTGESIVDLYIKDDCNSNTLFREYMFSEYFITLEEYRNSMIDKLLK